MRATNGLAPDIVTIMRSLKSGWGTWAYVAVVAAALSGCQRLDEEAPPGSDAPADTDIDLDTDVSGGSLLEGGGEGGSDEGGVETECDPVTSFECSDGEKCAVVLEGDALGYACVPEAGSQSVGQDCTVSLEDGLDGCTAGSVCLGDDAGTCRPLCNAEADCTAALCLEDPIHQVPHCADDCSPFEPNCSGLLQCRRQDDRFSCIDALPGDVGGLGEACLLEGDAGCGEGLMCVTGALVPGCASGGCCVSLCDLDALDSCSSPSTCNAALEAPAPGFEAVGACFVPA